MEESVEKSCWGITLWTIIVVLVMVLVGSFILGTDVSVSATEKLAVTL